ncbi:hypothetical protein BH10PSE13_BH10PSE13_23710 [soil metagenome]
MSHFRILTPVAGLRRTDVPAELARKAIPEGVVRLHPAFARELLKLGAVEPTDEDVTVRVEGDDFDDTPLPAFLDPHYDGDNGAVIPADDRGLLIAAIEALGGCVYFSGEDHAGLAERFSDTELRAEFVRRMPGARIVPADDIATLAEELPAPELLGELVKRVEAGAISFASFPPQLLPPPPPPVVPEPSSGSAPPERAAPAKPKAPARPKAAK